MRVELQIEYTCIGDLVQVPSSLSIFVFKFSVKVP